MHVAMIGASGLVGSEVLKKLLANQVVEKVTIITRRKLPIDSNKLNQIVFNEINPSILGSLNLNADSYFCALGTTIKKAKSKEAFKLVDYHLIYGFADLALRDKSNTLVVISALGANESSSIFYNKVKGEVERDIEALGIENTYFLRPSLLVGERKERRFLEGLGVTVFNLLSPFLPHSLMQKMGSRVEDIASKATECLLNPKKGNHRVFDFTS